MLWREASIGFVWGLGWGSVGESSGVLLPMCQQINISCVFQTKQTAKIEDWRNSLVCALKKSCSACLDCLSAPRFLHAPSIFPTHVMPAFYFFHVGLVLVHDALDLRLQTLHSDERCFTGVNYGGWLRGGCWFSWSRLMQQAVSCLGTLCGGSQVDQHLRRTPTAVVRYWYRTPHWVFRWCCTRKRYV